MNEKQFNTCLANIRRGDFHYKSRLKKIFGKDNEFSPLTFFEQLNTMFYLYAYAIEYNNELPNYGIELFDKHNITDAWNLYCIKFDVVQFDNDVKSIIQYLNQNDHIYGRDEGWKWRMKWKIPQ